MQFRFIYLKLLSIGLFLSGCPSNPYPYYKPEDIHSICLETVDLKPIPFVPQKESLIKVFVMPTKYRTFVAGFVNEFVSGLESKGWIVVDYESQLQSDDISRDIQIAARLSRDPDIVAFYLADFIERKDPWEALSKAPFTRLLITEDLNFSRSHEIAREFTKWGDAVFARYPEAFTKVVAPNKVLAFPLYHSASHWYLEAFDTTREKKPRALLSGAISSSFYPLRAAASRIIRTHPHLIEKRRFPGYGTNIDPDAEAKDYAQDLATYALSITGAGMGDTPAPYILAKHFEIAGAGGVAITDEFVIPQLLKLGFIENVHFVAATPGTLQEVVEKWLLPENQEKLRQMGIAAHELVKDRHTIAHRVDQFDSTAIEVYRLKQLGLLRGMNSILETEVPQD